VTNTQLNVAAGFDVTAACAAGYESTGAGPAAASCGAASASAWNVASDTACDGRNELGSPLPGQSVITIAMAQTWCQDSAACVSFEAVQGGSFQFSSTCTLSEATPNTCCDLYVIDTAGASGDYSLSGCVAEEAAGDMADVLIGAAFAAALLLGVRFLWFLWVSNRRKQQAQALAKETGCADAITTDTAVRYSMVGGKLIGRKQTLLEQQLVGKGPGGCGPCMEALDPSAALVAVKRAQARAFTNLSGCSDTAQIDYYIWGGGQDLTRTPKTREGRLWTQNISRSTPEEMEESFISLVKDLELESHETLAFHFTTEACANMIFAQDSIGMRASGGGIGGAGVYVCSTPLHDLGWEQYGGDGWREKVGRALWAENWANVLLGGSDEDKVEVALVLKVDKTMLHRYTDERPHAAVIKRKLLIEDNGHHWFPNSEIVKIWGMASPGGDVTKALKNFWRDIRVGKPGVTTAMSEGESLWIENISRSTPDEMRSMCDALADDLELKDNETLAFHFTTEASARLIFAEDSIGLRASSESATECEGVYVCSTPLHKVGWEQYGGDGWRENVGRALWADNWANVMLDGSDQSKVEVVLALKVDKAMLYSYTDELPHAAVIKHDVLIEGNGHYWFPNTEIVKVWGLTNDFEAAKWDDEEAKKNFHLADVDGSGTLGRDEVKAMLTQRGLTATDGYVDGIFDGYDQDSSGSIDYSEFASLAKMIARRQANGAGSLPQRPQRKSPEPVPQRAVPPRPLPERALPPRRDVTPPRPRPPSLAGLVSASVIVRKRTPPTLPSAAEIKEVRRQKKEERTEAEQAQMAAKSEKEFQARKAKTALAKLKASQDQVGP
jgi:hypothetical protein